MLFKFRLSNSSAFAGSTASFVTSPLDMAKLRLQVSFLLLNDVNINASNLCIIASKRITR